jgi:hypothetical protein
MLQRNIKTVQKYLNWNWKIVDDKKKFFEAMRLWEKRMKELEVHETYIGDQEYYNVLNNFSLNNANLLAASDDITQKIIVAELFVFDKKTVYLLHSSREINDQRSSNLHNYLVHQAIYHFKRKGFSSLVLGGGVSNSSEDSLLKFKKKFSETSKYFYIGKRIFNENIYTNLCQIWKKQFPHLVDEKQNFILKYRFTV